MRDRCGRPGRCIRQILMVADRQHQQTAGTPCRPMRCGLEPRRACRSQCGDGERREQMTPPRPRDLTDEELRAVSRWVVRSWLEVERGHRHARTLRSLLAPHLYFALEQAVRRPGAPAVAARDVGGAQFNKIGKASGYAVVVVRDADGRTRAVTVVMRRSPSGAWHVVDLRRIEMGDEHGLSGAGSTDAPGRLAEGVDR